MNALPYAGDTAAMKVSYIDASVSAHDQRFALVVVLCALLPLALVSILSVVSGLLLGTALAAAIAPHQSDDLTGKKVDSHVLDGMNAAEGDEDVLHLDQRRALFRHPSLSSQVVRRR